MAIHAMQLPAPDAAFEADPSAPLFDPEAAIGEQLRELHQLKNLTLKEVSERAGISVGYLS